MGMFGKIIAAGAAFGFVLATTGTVRAESVWDQGKLLATGAVTQVEGAGGSGLTPWALITGYGTERGIGVNAHYSFAALDDFSLHSVGAAVGFYDRLELSVTRQWFDTGAAGGRLGLGEGFTFEQDVWGAKLRVLGDAIYAQDSWVPQVAIGAQYKKARNEGILAALGALKSDDIEFYAVATKALLKHSLIITAGARLTRANHFGLLGYGAANEERSLQFEGSLGYMLRRNLIVGVDYRSKPDNLDFAEEGDATAVYGAYFFNKNVSLTAAVVDLGPVALQGRQQGFYLSLQAGF